MVKRRQIYTIIASGAVEEIELNVDTRNQIIILDSILYTADQTTTLEVVASVVVQGKAYPLPSPGENLDRIGQKVEYDMLLSEGDRVVISIPSGDSGKLITVVFNYREMAKES